MLDLVPRVSRSIAGQGNRREYFLSRSKSLHTTLENKLFVSLSVKVTVYLAQMLPPKINDPIWPVFKSIRDFIYVHLSCKFQEVPIKTKWTMVMTKSIRGFCSNQECVTLRSMTQLSQILNLSKISSMPTLSASFRKSWSKLNELCWWQSQTEAFSAFSAIKGK